MHVYIYYVLYLLSYYIDDNNDDNAYNDVCMMLHHYHHHNHNHHYHHLIHTYIGESVSIWDDTRSSPLHSYKWGADSVLSVKFNPAESSLLASTGIVR